MPNWRHINLLGTMWKPFQRLESRQQDLQIKREIAELQRNIRDLNSDQTGFWQRLLESASEQGAQLFLQGLIFGSGFLMVIGPLGVNVVLSWTGHPTLNSQESNDVKQTGRDVILISIGVKGGANAVGSVASASKKRRDDDED